MGLTGKASYAGNTDPGNCGFHYAWSENTGWINFLPSSAEGAVISATGISGYAWGENIGWINLSPAGAGVSNDGIGNLSGYAWGENIGWINFAPVGAGVRIDRTTGVFSGQAWGENIGWINFGSDGQNTFGLKTSWVNPPVTIIKPGDCNGDGKVSIAEVQSAINMFLGLNIPLNCVDIDKGRSVSISEVQKTINSFLGL
ncbi:MAG: EF-hand domain-containing protein [Deltaproteobacteria bacterium]|nr:EF-hand domain-containing protein [Deltaproteobacteria bacterium]